MFGSGSADTNATASHRGIALFQAGRANVNHRQVSIDHSILDLLILDSSDDAVSPPVMKPGWRLITPALLSEMNFPVRSFPHVSSNSDQQTAAISIRGFDQQRHLWTSPNIVSVIKHNRTRGLNTDRLQIWSRSQNKNDREWTQM